MNDIQYNDNIKAEKNSQLFNRFESYMDGLFIAFQLPEILKHQLFIIQTIYYMDPRQQLNLMDKISRELDDLKNSQTSVLKKISQIEADNINLGLNILEEKLPEIHEEVDDAVEKISALQDQFTEKRDEFAKDNPLSEEDPTA